jgi:predicted HicB family RNase H-like nuclease
VAVNKITPPREVFSTRINPDLVRELKHLAVDENKALNELIEEAIRLLLALRKK